MGNIKLIPLIVIYAVLVLGSCAKTKSYAAEIADLNGTWLVDRSNKGLPEGGDWYIVEFSWGKGKVSANSTFHVDLTAEEPFITEPGLGRFPIIDTSRTGADAIKIHAYRGDLDGPDGYWLVEVIFHFIDRDTVWIETNISNNLTYKKGVIWRRLSGPER